MIVTNITYKASWFDLKKKRSPKKYSGKCSEKSEEKSEKKSFYITTSKYFNDFRDYHFDYFTDMYIFLANDYKAY